MEGKGDEHRPPYTHTHAMNTSSPHTHTKNTGPHTHTHTHTHTHDEHRPPPHTHDEHQPPTHTRRTLAPIHTHRHTHTMNTGPHTHTHTHTHSLEGKGDEHQPPYTDTHTPTHPLACLGPRSLQSPSPQLSWAQLSILPSRTPVSLKGPIPPPEKRQDRQPSLHSFSGASLQPCS